MKILCLHGKGTSDKIFESQTQSFRSLLPSHYTYDFLAGDHPMTTYPEISDFFPGPYLCYHITNTMGDVREAMEGVREVVEDEMEDEGGFEGVVGFSQGAALAAALILDHQLLHPLSPPLFRFAVFIAGGPPFSHLPDRGVDVTSLYISPYDGSMSGDIVNHEHELAVEEGRYQPSLPNRSSFGNTASKVRRYNARVENIRIEIPTAHVYGRNDVDMGKAEQLVELCEGGVDGGKRQVFVHEGGHNVPVGREVSEAIKRVVEAVEGRSRMGV